MPVKLYQPFNNNNFSDRFCFLTGAPLSSLEERVQVFPQWLMTRFGLEDKPFKLLDERIVNYKDIKLPCATVVNNQYLIPLENEVAQAFEQGYEAVKALDGLRIFQWAARLLYGLIFNEIQAGIRQQHAQGEEFQMSKAIIHKFNYLHLMLQSINLPIEFDGFQPFSLFLFKVDNAEDDFLYRDEINTLTFSIRLKDFGLIICLQDNGANKHYHKELLGKIGEQTLHPIQFEEFCGKVFYSAYLFNRLPEYNILDTGQRIYIEAMPLRGMNSKPLFDDWQTKIYGQVLENFWKRWGFLLFEIIKDPEHTMSFLTRRDGSFIPADEVTLEK